MLSLWIGLLALLLEQKSVSLSFETFAVLRWIPAGVVVPAGSVVCSFGLRPWLGDPEYRVRSLVRTRGRTVSGLERSALVVVPEDGRWVLLLGVLEVLGMVEVVDTAFGAPAVRFGDTLEMSTGSVRSEVRVKPISQFLCTLWGDFQLPTF